jgi:predicted dehydrogenase
MSEIKPIKMETVKMFTKRNSPSRREFIQAAAVAAAAGVARSARSASPSDKVRLAVVGGGFGASHHWHEHPNCVVTAVSDLVDERRAALAKAYGCKSVFPSLENLIEKASDTFDAVAIFTEAPNHAKHVLMCFDAKKHVVSACPAAITLEDCRKIKDAKEKTGLRYMMHESSYYRQPCIAARELYQAGEFGRLVFSEVEYYHPTIGARTSGLSMWRGQRTWRWGFPPMLYPTHSLGLLVGVTRERIVKVSAIGQTVGQDFPVRDNAYDNPYDNEAALGVTNQGNVCRFNVFWNVAADGERGQWLGEKLSCYMSASGGQPQAMMKLGQGWKKWDVPNYWQTDRLPAPMRHDSGHGGSSAFLCAEFINALLENREPAVDVYESLAMTAPGIVAHESALKGGSQLDVPSFDKA